MNEKESFSVRFFSRSARNDNGKDILYARITAGGERIELSLKQEVTSGLFNQKIQRCTGKSKEDTFINKLLDSVNYKLLSHRSQLMTEGKQLSAELLKCRYLGLTDPDIKPNPQIIELYAAHNIKLKELIGIDIAKATCLRHDTSIRHVKNFIQYRYAKKDLDIELVDFTFLNDYAHYLKTVCVCNHNTTMKYIKNLGKVIRLAIAEGYIQINPFDKFKLTYKPVHREILTPDEIQTLIDLEMPENRLDKVRDLFVFCIYTGLAFVDVSELNMEHLVRGKEGVLWIKNTRHKTSIEFMIPLLPVAMKIIKKYDNHPIRQLEGKVLPTLSNQKYNSYLKDLATRANINKNLTSHIARHTFATTITLSEGVPLEVVSKMLGHTNTRTTQIYAKVKEASILHGMKGLMEK